MMIAILESPPDKVISPTIFPFPCPPPLHQMSSVQLVGLQQKRGLSVCGEEVKGGFEGWREIIACWCICVAGGSRLE